MDKILFLGATCVDVIINIDHLPSTGEDLSVHQSSWQLGGCAYNASHVARQLKIPSLLYSPIGQGPYGEIVYHAFLEKNLPTPILRQEHNGCCYCLVEANGERTFLSEHGTEYKYTQADLDKLKKQNFSAIYISGLEIEETSGDLLIDYLYQVASTPLYFCPGPRISFVPEDKLEKIYARSPILHLNENEAIYAGKHPCLTESLAYLFKKTTKPIVVTLGKKGACYYDGEMHFFPVEPITHPVDTIGAGDSHAGMLISQLALHQPLDKAMEYANEYARQVVMTKGSTLSTEQYQQIKREEKQ